MSVERDRGNVDPNTPGRAVERQQLLEQMMAAKESGDRRKVDAALTEANRWLKRGNPPSYVPDAAIENARNQLREACPVDPDDLS